MPTSAAPRAAARPPPGQHATASTVVSSAATRATAPAADSTARPAARPPGADGEVPPLDHHNCGQLGARSADQAQRQRWQPDHHTPAPATSAASTGRPAPAATARRPAARPRTPRHGQQLGRLVPVGQWASTSVSSATTRCSTPLPTRWPPARPPQASTSCRQHRPARRSANRWPPVSSCSNSVWCSSTPAPSTRCSANSGSLTTTTPAPTNLSPTGRPTPAAAARRPAARQQGADGPQLDHASHATPSTMASSSAAWCRWANGQHGRELGHHRAQHATASTSVSSAAIRRSTPLPARS